MADSTSLSAMDIILVSKPPKKHLLKYEEVVKETFHSECCIKLVKESTKCNKNIHSLLDLV